MATTNKLVLVVTAGASATNASFPLSKLLLARGHRMVYLSVDSYKEYIERQGFEFHTFGPPPEYGQDHPGARLNRFARHRLHVRKLFSNRDYIHRCAGQWLEENKPALVLLDSKLILHAAPILAQKIPIINLNANLSDFYSPVSPPVFSGLFPAGNSGVLAKLKINLSWACTLSTQLIMEFAGKISFYIGFGTTEFQTTATKIKSLGGKMKRTEYGLRLKVPEIVLGPRVIDFPDIDGRIRRQYAGICVDEHRLDFDFDFDSLDQREGLIYCSMGTHSLNYSFRNRYYRCLFDSMKQLPQYQLVLQTDSIDDLRVFGNIPENVKVFPRVPQLGMLKRARLFITHGGFSSIREGIYYGTPMIVFPGWHDQPGNAARVVYHGIGIRGNAKTVTTPVLVSMIKNVMADRRVRSSIERMRNAILDNNEIESAVRLIEAYTGDCNRLVE